MLRSLAAVLASGIVFTFTPSTVSSVPVVEQDVCLDGAGCPTQDPNVDCWTDGKWYYNRCNAACTVESR